MKTQYHHEITVSGLGAYFSHSALQTIVSANLGQDALRFQFGHDFFHYDNNSFAAGDSYVSTLRQNVFDALRRKDARQAREEFGRLTHTVQDLYAHSNYVSLWRRQNHAAGSQEIDPISAEVLKDPDLRSGRLYYPLEVLSFIPFFLPLVLPMLPRDSHAWMNIDDPSRPDFEFAFAAAVKRSAEEYLVIFKELSPQQAALFTGKD